MKSLQELNEHESGETGIITLSKKDMDKLHSDGEVSVKLDGATYVIKYQEK